MLWMIFPFCIEQAAKYIHQYSEWILIGTANNGDIAHEEIRRLKPDVVLTNIYMPGMSGISLANKIDDIAQVVFVTGEPQWAFRDVDWKNNIYILKILTAEKFRSIVKEVEARLTT